MNLLAPGRRRNRPSYRHDHAGGLDERRTGIIAVKYIEAFFQIYDTSQYADDRTVRSGGSLQKQYGITESCRREAFVEVHVLKRRTGLEMYFVRGHCADLVPAVPSRRRRTASTGRCARQCIFPLSDSRKTVEDLYNEHF